MTNGELLLTPEELGERTIKDIVAAYGSEVMALVQADKLNELPSLTNGATNEIEAQLAKAKPLIEKPLREKIGKLQKKLVTTNVYYLKELQEVRKDERERIIREIEEKFMLKPNCWTHELFKEGTVIIHSISWQALKEEK